MKIDATLWKPVLPREHGLWIIAVVPMLTALAISLPGSHQPPVRIILFLVAFAFFLLSMTPVIAVVKKIGKGRGVTRDKRNFLWAVLYPALSLLFFISLLLVSRLWGILYFLIPIAAVLTFYFRLVLRGRNRDNLAIDLVGAAGLCMSAPMAYYASLGRMDTNALMLYIINAGFFSTRVLFAKRMLSLQKDDSVLSSFKTRRKYFRRVSLLNVLIIHVLVFCAIIKVAPHGAVTSLLPGSIYTWKQIFSLKQKPNIRSVGLKEMGVAFLFSAVLIYVYH